MYLRKKRRHAPQPPAEVLELRQMLSGVCGSDGLDCRDPGIFIQGGEVVIQSHCTDDSTAYVGIDDFGDYYAVLEIAGGETFVEYLPYYTFRATFRGGAGDDFFWIEAGIDSQAWAGGGDDILIGGWGTDYFYGEEGHDYLDGNWEPDYLDAGPGHDIVFGGSGGDLVLAGDGHDYINTHSGQDTILAGDGDDWILSGSGHDDVYGEGGNDYVRGGRGDDYIDGGHGFDALYGESGNDTLMDDANDALIGGVGLDLLDPVARAAAPDPGTVDFSSPSAGLDVFGTQVQDGSHEVLDGGATLSLEGNVWRRIDLNYALTPNTVLEFDFYGEIEGGHHGIGVDADNLVNTSRFFRLWGVRDSQVSNYRFITDFDSEFPASSGWRHYVIPIGQYFSGEHAYLFFSQDENANGSVAASQFSNVRVYEA